MTLDVVSAVILAVVTVWAAAALWWLIKHPDIDHQREEQQ